MKIGYISSEISPIAKVGGLADVSLGLSRAIQAMGNQTFVMIPKYKSLKTKYLEYIKELDETFSIRFDNKVYQIKVWEAKLYDMRIYLLDACSPHSFFDSPLIYGEKNDLERFSFFSLAALEYINLQHRNVDLIHLNDWHTALVAPLYQYKFKTQFNAKIVFTIHNMNYQGVTELPLFDLVGLPKDPYLQQCLHPADPHKINLIKTGIVFSDFVNTVSPNYYHEIKNPQNGHGLESVVLEYEKKFTGILNGIDYDIWDPKIDKALFLNYSAEELEKKYLTKDYLRKELQIPLKDRTPLVACICRLVPQKGLPMIKHAIKHTLNLGGQFILFGSSPIPQIQEDFNQLKIKYTENPNVKFIFDSYNEELAHQIYAGSDMLICPSLFEPCGLTQMIALHYGTVPIVRQTGGLADTIFDIEHHELAEVLGNGFSYLPPTKKAIENTLTRAFKVYHEKPLLWKKTIERGMKMDYSWQASAQKYFDIYSKITSKQ